MNESKLFKNFACGIIIVKAENANFNADFTGYPRTLPDGTFFATDKALKYCIRKYWHDFGENVIFWRRYDKEGYPYDLDNNITKLEFLKNIIKDTSSLTEIKKAVLKQAIDVKMFGGTFTLKSENNFSITGPVQITYGVDKYKKGKPYSVDILSPKPNKSKKNEKKPRQFSKGIEYRIDKVFYVYDFTINPNNLLEDESLKSSNSQSRAEENIFLTDEDIKKFKDAVINGVGYVTSTPKIGAVTSLMIFAEFENKNDDLDDSSLPSLKVPLIPELKHFVKIESKENKDTYDISEIISVLKSFSNLKSIEVYYNSNYSEIKYSPDDDIKINDLSKKK